MQILPRDADDEAGSHAEPAFRPDSPAVRFNDVLRYRKPKARPPQVAGPSLVHPVEPLEDSRKVLRGNPRSIISHLQKAGSLLGPARKADPSAVPSVFDCVVQEVRHGQGKLAHVCTENRIPASDHKRFSRPFGLCPVERRCAVEKSGERDLLYFQWRLPGFRP